MRRTPAFRHATGAILLGLTLTAALLATHAGSERRPGTDVTTAFSRMLERCSGDAACLGRETDTLVEATGPAALAEAAVTIYRENPRAVPACHTYMHLLGSRLTALVEKDLAPTLGDTWTECGAGLVHGAFENITFDPTNPEAIGRIVALCDGGQFAEPVTRHHACLHAVGHGIHTAVDGDLGRGEELCMRAVPDAAEFSRNHPCLAGLYMVDRDERVALLAVPDDAAGWGRLLSHCASSPRPGVCASSYSEIATRHGAGEALSYLDWCLGTSDETTCLLFLGQGATFRQIFATETTPSANDLDATTCPAAAAERGLDPAPCIDGTRQALKASGTDEMNLTYATCKLFTARNEPCPLGGNDDRIPAEPTGSTGADG